MQALFQATSGRTLDDSDALILQRTSYEHVSHAVPWRKNGRKLDVNSKAIQARHYFNALVALNYILQSKAAGHLLVYAHERHEHLYKLLQVLSLFHGENENKWSSTLRPMFDTHSWRMGIEFDLMLVTTVNHLTNAMVYEHAPSTTEPELSLETRRARAVEALQLVSYMIINWQRELLDDMAYSALAQGAVIECNIRSRPVGIHYVLHRILAAMLARGMCATSGLSLTLEHLFGPIESAFDDERRHDASVATGRSSLVDGDRMPHAIPTPAQLILEAPLRTTALLAQTRAQMWLCNGLEWRALVATYGDEPRYQRFRDLDLFLMQVAAARMARNTFVASVLARFGTVASRVAFARQLTTTEREDRTRDITNLEQCWLLLLRVITSRRLCSEHGESLEAESRALLRQELMHSLFIKPSTHSALLERLPRYMALNTTHVSQILDEIATTKRQVASSANTNDPFASFHNRLGAHSSSAAPLVYCIKPELWREFDPYFGSYSLADMHAAEDSYAAHVRSSAGTMTSEAAGSEEELPLAPYCRTAPAPMRSFEPLQELAHSRALQAFAFWSLFEWVHQVEQCKYSSASIVSRALHALHLALDARERLLQQNTHATAEPTDDTPIVLQSLSSIKFPSDDVVLNCTRAFVVRAGKTTWRSGDAITTNNNSVSLLSMLVTLYRTLEGAHSKRLVLQLLQRLADVSERIYSRLASPIYQMASLVTNRWRTSSNDDDDTAGDNDADEHARRKEQARQRREAARQRQQAIMQQFAKKQKQFLDTTADASLDNDATSSSSGTAANSTSGNELRDSSIATLASTQRAQLLSSTDTQLELQCVLCHEHLADHENNPIGLVAHIHPAGLVHFAKHRWPKIVADRRMSSNNNNDKEAAAATIPCRSGTCSALVGAVITRVAKQTSSGPHTCSATAAQHGRQRALLWPCTARRVLPKVLQHARATGVANRARHAPVQSRRVLVPCLPLAGLHADTSHSRRHVVCLPRDGTRSIDGGGHEQHR